MYRCSVIAALAAVTITATAAVAGDVYPRAGWTAEMTLGQHNSSGIATIIDERTIQVDELTFDGTVNTVFFRLGASNTFSAFLNGPSIGPELSFANGDTVVVQFPRGQTLDGYNAISIWCTQLSINFTSDTFEPPVCPEDLDGNNSVNGADLLQLLNDWGSTDSNADINFDGVVDGGDLLQLLNGWGAC